MVFARLLPDSCHNHEHSVQQRYISSAPPWQHLKPEDLLAETGPVQNAGLVVVQVRAQVCCCYGLGLQVHTPATPT